MSYDSLSIGIVVSFCVFLRANLRSRRTPHWKLVVDLNHPENTGLYDLMNDPGELNNLRDSNKRGYRKKRFLLRLQLENAMLAVGDD